MNAPVSKKLTSNDYRQIRASNTTLHRCRDCGHVETNVFNGGTEHSRMAHHVFERHGKLMPNKRDCMGVNCKATRKAS